MKTTSTLIPTSAHPPFEFEKGRLYESVGAIVLSTSERSANGRFSGVVVYSKDKDLKYTRVGVFASDWDASCHRPFYGSIEIRQEG